MGWSRIAGSRASAFLPAVVAVGAIAAAVISIGLVQRDHVRSTWQSTRAASTILSATIDSRDALQDYFAERRVQEIERIAVDQLHASEGLAAARRLSAKDPRLLRNLDTQTGLVREWNTLQHRVIARGSVTPADNAEIDRIYDELATANDAYSVRSSRRQTSELERATYLEGGLIVGGSLVALLAAFLIVRRNRVVESTRVELEAAERSEQRELVDSLQIASGEDETYALLRRHIQRSLPIDDVVVLNRDNSNDRLEPRTSPPEELADALIDASPNSCLAVRLGQTHAHGPEREPLLSCELCGRFDRVTCVPSLVGGEVIGSVLARHDGELSDRERYRLADSVSQAAPVLANLRNLAIAETRAMTDALTGLPNVRALQDNLKRMLAHAGRNATSLSLLAIDLDHFKQINDVYGHEKGDEALAAVGDLLGANLRASDLAARNGGEEFVVALPDTGKDGAVGVAENLRTRLEQMSINGLDRTVTASFGVATYPDDATEPAKLLRAADRALYLAKASGRNTVRAIEPDAATV